MSKQDRIKACELAAIVLSGQEPEQMIPYAWSLVVFFEQYITKGAKGALKDFGPKEPVEIRVAKQ